MSELSTVHNSETYYAIVLGGPFRPQIFAVAIFAISTKRCNRLQTVVKDYMVLRRRIYAGTDLADVDDADNRQFHGKASTIDTNLIANCVLSRTRNSGKNSWTIDTRRLLAYRPSENQHVFSTSTFL